MTTTIDTRELFALAQTLSRAAVLVDSELSHELQRHLDDVLDLMHKRAGSQHDPQNLVHVVTGRMLRSFAIVGPFKLGVGTLEGRIVPGVPYAIDEINRGGLHDYAGRTVRATVEERAAVAQRAARAVRELVEKG
jgi:Na+/H+-translocating membrane pyrophosphatase